MGKPQTLKKSKSVYVIGALTLGIVALIAVYFVLIATGVISAAPTRITVSSVSAVTEYSGKTFTDERWTLEEGELKEGHTLSVTFTGARTEVGESENSFTVEVYDENGYDVSSSYAFTCKPGKLTVVPRKIVVASASAEKNYDGTPLTAKSCALTDGTLVAGHEINYVVNGTLTAAGRTDNKFVATVRDGNRDVSANYDIEYLYGTLYVHGEMLNISTGSASKVYDGKPVTSDSWLLISGKLANEHTLAVTPIGTQTEVGESENIATCVVTDAAGVDVTAMYETVFQYGTLTVKPITIYVETRSAYKVYDGKPLTADGWRVSTDSAIANDVWYSSGRTVTVGEYTVTATVVGSQTDVGISDNTAVFLTVTRDGAPAEGVAVECECGELVVDKRNLTIQSGSAGKPFDGTPLTCDEWSIVSITQPAEGHIVQVSVCGTNTFPGITDNDIAEYIVLDENGANVTRNYNVKVYLGKLSVYGDTTSSGGDIPGVGPGDGPGGNEEDPPEDVGDVDGSGNVQGGNSENDNGGGGGGGDGASDVDGNGEIGGGGGGGSNAVVMRLYADDTTKVYLKQQSYGDYNFTGWKNAAAYSDTIVKQSVFGGAVAYGMDYLTGIALSSVGRERIQLSVEPMPGVNKYYLPYFLDMTELDYAVQRSDVEYNNNSGQYSAYFYSYTYVSDNGAALGSAELGSYADYELNYRKFVSENYTAVPDGTREYLQTVIDEKGFASLGFSQKIAAVAEYIRHCAKYSLDYDTAMDDEPDSVIAFLDKYKVGVCRHYASSATLMYRTLGIPARYTVGLVGNTQAGEWTDVTAENAHAWVEVYVDGIGWVNVEVTGSGENSFGGGGGSGDDGPGGGGGGTGVQVKGKYPIKPRDVYVKYSDWVNKLNSRPVTYSYSTLQGLSELEKQGYFYTFTVSGSQTGLGIGESVIEDFKLFDNLGNDVTEQYECTASPGKLQIYMREITVQTASRSKMYDGTPLIGADEDWNIIGSVLDGHKYSVTMIDGLTDIGNDINKYAITVTDENGNDVTDMYKVNSQYGQLSVTARAVVVTAGSVVGYLGDLDGGELNCHEYTVDAQSGVGGLCEGHTATVVLRGGLKGIGRCQNEIQSVVITDANGNDVTKNYSIITVNGTITLLPDSLKPNEPLNEPSQQSRSYRNRLLVGSSKEATDAVF